MWIAAALLAGCGPAAQPHDPLPIGSASAPPAPRSAENAALEAEVSDLVNRHRVARGLRALTLDERIGREARRHSAAMAAGRIPPGHEGFRARIQATGLATCRRRAENVAFNHGHASPGSVAVDSWLGSRGHRANIEGPYEITGVGVASNAAGEYYFTQIFLGECASSSRSP